MGQKLAATLNRLIDAQTTEEMPRPSIIEKMASAAGIEVNTVHQILQGEINCPPLERLRGFAKVLSGASAESLVQAAAQDGCKYPRQEEPDQVQLREVMPGAKYRALEHVAERLEQALSL